MIRPWNMIVLLAIWSCCYQTVAAQLIGNSNDSQLNILFLVEAIAVFFVAIAIFFFWNRLLGIVVGFALRLYLWKTSKIHVTIQSLQISPLAGRILFKDVRYHSTNMSARILLGHITWRYWKWNIRKEGASDRLPSRCLIHLEGLEWFLYNRSPAFDAIVDRMKAANESVNSPDSKTKDSSSSDDDTNPALARSDSDSNEVVDQPKPTEEKVPERLARPLSPPIPNAGILRGRLSKLTTRKHQEPWQWQRDFLPVDIEVATGAVVLGNDATPIVTVAEFKKSRGSLETTESRSKLDLFKSVASFSFTGVKVLVRTNPDYTGALLDHGRRAYEELTKNKPSILKEMQHTFLRRADFGKLAEEFEWLSNQFFAKPPPYASAYYGSDKEWKGLARYRTDIEEDVGPSNPQLEYAKVTTVLEARKIDLVYYSDVAGIVPDPEEHVDQTSDARKLANPQVYDVGNGDLPPEWGLEFVVHEMRMVYGPWHDRQRDAFTKAFTPAIFYQSTKTDKLKPGDFRMHTEMRVHIELDGQSTIRVPTRESSKDWDYDKLGSKPKNQQRKYGWMDIDVGPKSSIRYVMPLVASQAGFDALMVMEFYGLSASSSINYANFLKTSVCRVRGSMPTPLQWDARRDWTFDVDLVDARISLLRDHITLISDLAKDWSSGATGDFHHFIPCDYQFRITLTDFLIKLYLNDFNIVDSPNKAEANCLLDINGTRIYAEVEVPLIRFRPESSTIPFSVQGTDLALNMFMPNWHTQNTFGGLTATQIGKVDKLRLRGSYLYYAEVTPEHVECLTLFIYLDGVSFRVIGWAIRRLMLVKDNYAGSFLNFQTTQDFHSEFSKQPKKWGDKTAERYRPGKSDIFEVNLELEITNGIAILPRELYECVEATIIPVPKLEIHLRSHEAFMELIVNARPTSIFCTTDSGLYFDSRKATTPYGGRALYLGGLSIRANRLFGRPPSTPTYLCLWDFLIPQLSGHYDPSLLKTLQTGISNLSFTYGDPDNAPLPLYALPLDKDVTIFKVAIPIADLTAWIGSDAVNLKFRDLIFDTNDRASLEYASLTGLNIRDIEISALQESHILENGTRSFHRLASANFSLSLDSYKAPIGWHQQAAAQQAFLRQQDADTRRVAPMYMGHSTEDGSYHVGPLFLPRPFGSEGHEDSSSDSQSDGSESTSTCSTSESDYSLYRASRKEYKAVPSPDGLDDSEGSASTSAVNLPLSGRSSKPRRLDKIAQVYALNREHGETSFVKLLDPTADLRWDHCAVADVAAAPRMEHADTTSPSQERSYSFTSVTFPQGVQVTLTPEAAELAARFRLALLSDETENVAHGYERWLDESLVQRWDFLKSRCDVPDSHTTTLSIITPTVQLVTASANDSHSPLTGIQQGEGSDFDVVTLKMQLRHPAFTKSTVLNAEDGSMSDSGTATEVKFDQLAFDLDVQNSRGVGRSRSLAMDKGSLVSGGCTNGHLHMIDGQDEFTLRGTGDDMRLNIATNAVPALASLSSRWKPAIESNKLVRPLDPSIYLRLTWDLIQAAETHSITSEPAFLGQTGPLLRPPDNMLMDALQPRSALSLRQDIGWRILSQLRHYLRQLQRTSASPFLRGDETSESLDEDIQAVLYSHFAHWRDWDVAAVDWANLGFLRCQAIVSESTGGNSTARSGGQLDRKISTCFQQVKISLFDITALKGQQLAAMDIQDLRFAISDSFITGNTLQIQTVDLAVRSWDVGLHVDLSRSVGPALEAYDTHVESIKSSPIRSGETPKKLQWFKNLLLKLAIERLRLSANAEPLQFAFESEKLNVLYAASRAAKAPVEGPLQIDVKDALSVIVERCAVMVIHLKKNPRGHAKHPPYIFSLSFKQVQSLLCPNPTSLAMTLIVQSIEVDTSYDPRQTQTIVEIWKRTHYGELERLTRHLKDRASKNKDHQPIKLQRPMDALCGQIVIKVLHSRARYQASDTVVAFWEIKHYAVQASRQIDSLKDPNLERIDACVQLGDQSLGFLKASEAETLACEPQSPNVMVRLPSAEARGSILLLPQDASLSGSITLDRFTGTFKPSVCEKLLSILRAMEQDGQALTSIGRSLQQTKPDAVATQREEARVDAQPVNRKMRYSVKLRIRGICVSLQAAQVVSTLTIETGVISGNIANDAWDADPEWNANVSSLSLRLGHCTGVSSGEKDGVHQLSRSASMTLSLEVLQAPEKETLNENGALQHRPTTIAVNLSGVHATLQVSALNEIYELMSSWSTDLASMRDKRKDEWDKVMTKTERLMKPDNNHEPVRDPEDWFMMKRIINVRLDGLAVAIPLTLHDSSTAANNIPALLFTMGLIEVSNQKGDSGKVEIMDVILQIVKSFDSTDVTQYDGLSHTTRNRMHLPHTLMEVRVEKGERRLALANSTFKGFELKLDPQIIEYAFMLQEVYQAGRSQIEQLAQEFPLDSAGSGFAARPSQTTAAKHSSLPINVQIAFNFYSGSVLLYHGTMDEDTVNVSSHYQQDRRRNSHSHAADNIRLPGISLWVRGEDEQRPPTNAKNYGKTVQVFLVIHASENLLRPSILRFVEEATKGIAARHKKAMPAEDHPRVLSGIQAMTLEDYSFAGDSSASTVNSQLSHIRWEFALRIDQSRIRLTCMPDSPVLAGLAWQSGGVTAQYCPERRRLVATLAVAGVAFDIRHEWLKDQECVAGRVTNMTGSLTWDKERRNRPAMLNAIVDLEISAAMKLSRIQDLLCFKAVWIDSLSLTPQSSRPMRPMDSDRSDPILNICGPQIVPAPLNRHLVLIKIRRVELKADLNVSQVLVEVEPMILRLRKTATEERLGGEIRKLRISSTGVISGALQSNSIRLSANRYPKDIVAKKATLLHLGIDIAATSVEIQHESQPFAYLSISPSTLSLHDDWSDMDGRAVNSDASLSLSFLVNVGDIDGFAAILALPAVFESFERVEQTWRHQVDNAKSESFAYRRYLEYKPDDAFAAVAATMQKSAQQKRQDDCLVNVKIVRRMNLRANKARIGIYMSSLSETELYRLCFESLSTELQRESGINGDTLRMFSAYLEGIQFHRHIVKPPLFRQGKDHLPLDEWHGRIGKIGKAMKVITLPTTTITMSSIESSQRRTLQHDFALDYGDARLEVDFQLGVYKEIWDMFETFKQLWARRQALHPEEGLKAEDKAKDTCGLRMVPGDVRAKTPQMSILGDTAQDLFGRYSDKYLAESPHVTHHLIISLLEPVMHILVKIYDNLLEL